MQTSTQIAALVTAAEINFSQVDECEMATSSGWKSARWSNAGSLISFMESSQDSKVSVRLYERNAFQTKEHYFSNQSGEWVRK